MNSNIIGATVYAYKHKDYGDVFLYLYDTTYETSKITYFKITDKPDEAIANYHCYCEKFDKMIEDLQEEYVYAKSVKDYEDAEGYSGTLEKTIPFQIKDFVKVAFVADYIQVD